MFGNLENGWALDVLVVWVAFRLLSTAWRGVVEGRQFVRASPYGGPMLCAFTSGGVLALAFGVGWRWVFPPVNAETAPFFYAGGLVLGFVAGFHCDFCLHFFGERWIAERLVALRRAAYIRELPSGNRDERLRAAHALSYFGRHKWALLPLALDVLRSDPEADVRAAVAGFAFYGFPDEPEVRAAAHQALRDADRRVWCAAASLLVKQQAVPTDTVLAPLTALLSHEDLNVSLTAAGALGELGAAAASAIPSLIALLDQSLVWPAAAVALRKIGAAAVPALAERLGGGRLDGRLAAAQTLAMLGTTARPASRALSAALQDPEPRLRAAAQQALKAIETRPAPALDKWMHS